MTDHKADESEILALIHAKRVAYWARDFDAWQHCFAHVQYLTHPMRKSGELRLAMDRLLAQWRDEDRAADRASYMDVTELIDAGTHIDPCRESVSTNW